MLNYYQKSAEKKIVNKKPFSVKEMESVKDKIPFRVDPYDSKTGKKSAVKQSLAGSKRVEETGTQEIISDPVTTVTSPTGDADKAELLEKANNSVFMESKELSPACDGSANRLGSSPFVLGGKSAIMNSGVMEKNPSASRLATQTLQSNGLLEKTNNSMFIESKELSPACDGSANRLGPSPFVLGEETTVMDSNGMERNPSASRLAAQALQTMSSDTDNLQMTSKKGKEGPSGITKKIHQGMNKPLFCSSTNGTSRQSQGGTGMRLGQYMTSKVACEKTNIPTFGSDMLESIGGLLQSHLEMFQAENGRMAAQTKIMLDQMEKRNRVEMTKLETLRQTEINGLLEEMKSLDARLNSLTEKRSAQESKGVGNYTKEKAVPEDQEWLKIRPPPSLSNQGSEELPRLVLDAINAEKRAFNTPIQSLPIPQMGIKKEQETKGMKLDLENPTNLNSDSNLNQTANFIQNSKLGQKDQDHEVDSDDDVREIRLPDGSRVGRNTVTRFKEFVSVKPEKFPKLSIGPPSQTTKSKKIMLEEAAKAVVWLGKTKRMIEMKRMNPNLLLGSLEGTILEGEADDWYTNLSPFPKTFEEFVQRFEEAYIPEGYVSSIQTYLASCVPESGEFRDFPSFLIEWKKRKKMLKESNPDNHTLNLFGENEHCKRWLDMWSPSSKFVIEKLIDPKRGNDIESLLAAINRFWQTDSNMAHYSDPAAIAFREKAAANVGLIAAAVAAQPAIRSGPYPRIEDSGSRNTTLPESNANWQATQGAVRKSPRYNSGQRKSKPQLACPLCRTEYHWFRECPRNTENLSYTQYLRKRGMTTEQVYALFEKNKKRGKERSRNHDGRGSDHGHRDHDRKSSNNETHNSGRNSFYKRVEAMEAFIAESKAKEEKQADMPPGGLKDSRSEKRKKDGLVKAESNAVYTNGTQEDAVAASTSGSSKRRPGKGEPKQMAQRSKQRKSSEDWSDDSDSEKNE
jgi:hypothetical protein